MSRIEIEKYIEILSRKTNISPNNLFEAGSRDGDDAVYLATQMGVPLGNVYVIEPHSTMYENISKKYPNLNVFNFALFNENGTMIFNEAENLDDGRSSLMSRDIYQTNFAKREVPTYRIDTFMEDNGVNSIDAFKLDVEGASYEVLESFGNRICDLKSIQIESEYYKVWDEQKIWQDIKYFMTDNNFKLMWQHDIIGIQVDSIWVQNKYIK